MNYIKKEDDEPRIICGGITSVSLNLVKEFTVFLRKDSNLISVGLEQTFLAIIPTSLQNIDLSQLEDFDNEVRKFRTDIKYFIQIEMK